MRASSSSSATVIFSPLSRRTATQWPASMSFGPISTRSGTPFISQLANFQPGLLSLKSPCARRPAAFRRATSSSAFSVTPGLCAAMGSTMTWIGAMCGGRTRPLLSPWVMIRPPMTRVDMPHEVWCG